MGNLLLAMCAILLAYGQKGDRPEIIPPEVLKGKDALMADPKHYKLEFENDHMRVLRLTLKADEVSPVHDDGDALFVCLKECHLRLTRPGGRSQDIHMQAGESRWIYADTRSEKNLGSQSLELLVIETK
jgi:hypothetical protein